MKKLTQKEEEIMQVLWAMEKAFVKEVLTRLPEEKPHYNTVSTIIRTLVEKGFVDHEAFGNTHRYFPVVTKESYRKKMMSQTIQSYFGGSYRNLVAHFAREEKISAEELKEILKEIENR